MTTTTAPAPNKAKLPPGPSIGALQAYLWNKDPLGFFEKNFAKYGDPFTTPFMFKEPVVCTAAPDGVAAIFGAPRDTFDVLGSFMFEPVLGTHSVIVLAGEAHKKERVLLAPAFHGDRIRAYTTLILGATHRHLKSIETGQRFLAQDLAQRIALDVILHAVFGLTDPGEVEEFGLALRRFIDAAKPALIISPLLRTDLGPWSPGGHLVRMGKKLDAMLYRVIEERRSESRSGSSGDDMLGLMLSARYEDGSAMSDAAVRDELVTMVMAGHETTASVLAFALELVHRDRAVLDRLRAEIGAPGALPPEELARLPYLEAVCQETLRLRPVVVDVVRRLVKPLTLRGIDLPPGVAVCAATLMSHFNPQVFTDPASFQPERFLQQKYSPYQHYPFGGGARRCIGAAFAMLEMKIVLATILSHVDVELTSDKPTPLRQQNIAWGPDGGVPLVLAARRA